jgi:hypothetical protein
MIRFRDAYDFNLWIVQRMIEKSLHVAVDQANDGDTERCRAFRRRALTLETCSGGCKKNHAKG